MPESHFDLDWRSYAKEMGLRLQTVREAQQVSQIELASVTGVSRNQIQNIENNRSSKPGDPGNTTIRTLFVLAQGLGVPVTLLLPEPSEVPRERYELDLVWPDLKQALVEVVKRCEVPKETRQSRRVGRPVRHDP